MALSFTPSTVQTHYVMTHRSRKMELVEARFDAAFSLDIVNQCIRVARLICRGEMRHDRKLFS